MRDPSTSYDPQAAAVAAHREERSLSWLRIVGGLVMIAVLPMFDAPLPTGGTWLAQAVAALAVATGIGGLVVLRQPLRAEPLLRLRYWSMGSDAVLTLLFTALYAEVAGLRLFILSLPIQGGMKLGARGAVALGLVAASSGFIAQSLRVALTDLPFDPTLAWAPVLPAAGFAALVAFLAASRSMEVVTQLRLGRDLDQAHEDVQVVHDVVEGSDVPAAVRQLLEGLVTRTELPFVALLERQGDQIVEHGLLQAPGTTRIGTLLAEAWPVAELAATTQATVVRGVGEHRAPVVAGATALAAVPVRSPGAITCVLVAESRRPEGLSRADVADLQRTADHLALVRVVNAVREERERLEREIGDLERARDQVLAIGSHELRTPLTTLVGFSELLATNGSDMEAHEVVRFGRSMHQAAGRLLRTLRDVQIADNLRRGVLASYIEAVDLGQLVTRTAGSWPGTVVRTGEPSRVDADAGHLTTVIERLIDNAWEHAGGAGLEVTWTRVGDQVVLSVVDTGPGLGDVVLAQLGKPFVQGQDVLAHQRGTGLGLAISQGLCTAMDARLVLASSSEAGTHWEVWLRLHATARSASTSTATRLDRRAMRAPDQPARQGAPDLH